MTTTIVSPLDLMRWSDCPRLDPSSLPMARPGKFDDTGRTWARSTRDVEHYVRRKRGFSS